MDVTTDAMLTAVGSGDRAAYADLFDTLGPQSCTGRARGDCWRGTGRGGRRGMVAGFGAMRPGSIRHAECRRMIMTLTRRRAVTRSATTSRHQSRWSTRARKP